MNTATEHFLHNFFHLRTFTKISLPVLVLTIGGSFLSGCGEDSVNHSSLTANQMCRIIEDQRSALNLEPAGVSDTGVCSYKTNDNNLNVYVYGPGSSYLDKDEPADIPPGKKHKTSENYQGWNIENTTIIPKNQDDLTTSCYSKLTTRDWSLLVLSVGTCEPAKATLHTLLKTAKK